MTLVRALQRGDFAVTSIMNVNHQTIVTVVVDDETYSNLCDCLGHCDRILDPISYGKFRIIEFSSVKIQSIQSRINDYMRDLESCGCLDEQFDKFVINFVLE